MKKLLRQMIRKVGYDLVRFPRCLEEGQANNDISAKVNNYVFSVDFNNFDKKVIESVKPYSMTSPERILSLIQAVQYVIENNIDGDIVECGVWRGGSIMAIALTLIENKSFDKSLYLFDTFDGMSPSSAVDISITGDIANNLLTTTVKTEEDHLWAYSPLEKVKEAVYSTGYPRDRFVFIKGMVEETIPKNTPSKISLLRLDTDWYESTKHELIHLFPRLAVGGILIIDDYGHWQGAKKAVDEYIKNNKLKFFLHRIDYTGRIGIKQCV